MARKEGVRRGLRFLGRGLLYSILGLCVSFMLALGCLNLPPVNRWVGAKINAALAETLTGTLIIKRLGLLHLSGINNVEIELRDAEQRPVLRARDIDASVPWFEIAYSALRGGDSPLVVAVRRVHVDAIHVELIDDGTGTPTLARALEPRDSSEPEPEQAGRPLELSIADIQLDLLAVRGYLPSPGMVDVDLSKLRAELAVNQRETRVVLSKVALNARQLPIVDTLTGHLEGSASFPAAPVKAAPGLSKSGEPETRVYTQPTAPEPLRVSAMFDGQLSGRDPLKANASVSGEQLRADVTLSSVSPETLSRIAGVSTKSPARISASATGALDDLGFEGAAQLGEARLSTRGRMRRHEARTRIRAELEAREVDLSALLPAAPSTSLFADATANVDAGSTATRIDYQVVSRGSALEEQVLPAATLNGEATLPESEPARFVGVLNVEEPGAPLELRYDVLTSEQGVIADVTARSQFTRPPRLAALAPGLSASGSLLGELHVDAARGVLRAHADVKVRELRHPQFRAGTGTLTFSALGSLLAPELELEANLRRVFAAGRTLPRVQVEAHGRLDQLKVEASASLDGARRAHLETMVYRSADAIRLTAPALRVQSPAGRLRVQARQLIVSPAGRLELEQLSASGPGRLRGSLSYAPGGSLDVSFETQDLDSGRLADILGFEVPLRLQHINLAGNLDTRRRSGKLAGNIAEIRLMRLDGSLDADLSMKAGRLSGTAELSMAKAGHARLHARDLDVPLFTTGKPELDALAGELVLAGDIDLAHLEPLLPLLGIERTKGQLRFDLAAQRDPGPGEPPTLRAHVVTKSLVLVGERKRVAPNADAEQAERAAPWTLRGIDVNLNAELARTTASLDVQLYDRVGALVQAEAKVHELARGKGLRALQQAFMRAPLSARIQVPRRVIEQLPAPIRPSDIEGIASARLDVSGSVEQPVLEARARVERFRPLLEQGRGPRGIDVEAGLSYREGGGRLRVDAHDRRRSLLSLSSQWDGDLRELVAAEGSAGAALDVEADLTDFPLALVPELQNRSINGLVSGSVRLSGLGRAPQLRMELQARRMELNRLPFRALSARARADEGGFELHAELDGKAGKARVQVQSDLSWERRLVPQLEGAVEGRLNADNFRLGALLPLLGGAVSELDGELDAEFRATLEGGAPQLSGRAHLANGVVHLPSIGQRFTDIRGDVLLTPDSLRIENVSARGTTGGLSAGAEARLSGLTPLSARAEIRIDQNDKLPLTLEGENIGDAWGVIEATYQHREDAHVREVHVDLQRLSVELPSTPPRGIQSLEQPAHIRVGYRSDEEFVPIPLQPVPEDSGAPADPEHAGEETIVIVDIGRVDVKKGQQAEVVLGGEIRATLGEELSVEGRVESRRGWLDISGKQFDIERATVTFTGGDPSDPTISAVARYDSPAGYVVYAEYTGTVQRGKLQLRSEPALGQDEILTLLLFGSPEGSFGAGAGRDSLSTAVSVAGSTATQGLNRALASVTDLDVSTRIDTSTGSPRPEIVVQLSPRVTARVTQALGEPAPGQSPDRTFFRVELRIARAWALSAMIGDRGASALDLIWRRRY